MAEERASPGRVQKIAGLPLWVRLLAIVVLVGLAVAMSDWLVLLLLIALGLWPITVLLGLAGLALFSMGRGGLSWLRTWLGARVRDLAIPLLSIFTALLIGGLVIMFTDQEVYTALGVGDIGGAVSTALRNLGTAYGALYQGAFGDPMQILEALGQALRGGGIGPVLSAVRGPSDSMVQSVPYIFAGLAVAVGFRAGLFNIGVEGQIGIGWIAAVVVGFSLTGLPWFVHLPLCILVGAAAGGLWASIAGFLRARTGAHEVITTIMLNYISFRLSEWLLCGPLEFTKGTCRTKEIAESAYLPRFLSHPVALHWGFVLALGATALAAWFLFRTTWGYELRTVGANPNAARYGGMSVTRTWVLAMFLSGCLAGLAGVSQGLGITHNAALGFQAGYGFDAIALALLGKSNPLGVLAAAIIFGVLRAGSARMQSVAGVPTEIVQIVQALVIVFIAAPAIIRAIYRLREERREEAELVVFSRGWGA
ncbi:MAG TPA: ABC transporter permease [Anaerolineae bacterium]|nr:ABC transporter permease [Anaerolineae bacterium]